MSPVPNLEYPRAQNASRRYHDPVTRKVDPASATAKPAVLAASPEDGRFHLLPGELDPHTRKAGQLVFDPSALDAVIEGQTARVLAPTLDGEVLTLEFDTIKTRDANTHTLRGQVAGEAPGSIVQIVYHDGIIHGNIVRYAISQELEYRIKKDGHMMVRELDHTTMTDGCQEEPEVMASIIENGDVVDDGPYFAQSSEEESTPRDTTGWRTLDVVVGYGQEARIADGGYAQIEARIIDAVDRMTAAFANSGITDAEVMLLGTIEDPDYLFSDVTDSRLSYEISALRTTDGSDGGDLDTVTNFSDQLGADLISFVIREGRGGTAGVASKDKYTVVGRTHVTPGRMVFSHELGHNLGCTHAWGDTNHNTDNSRYGWRFKSPNTGNKYETIMAYDGGWGGLTVPHYSNPAVLYDGARTGAVDGYNVQGDTTADPTFYSDEGFSGFDGTHPDLGANNAEVIDLGDPDPKFGAGLAYNSAHGMRTAFEVLNPQTGVRWEKGTTKTIKFNGGDMKDSASILLYKGGVLHSTLASDVNPATHRNFDWTIPFSHAEGTDFMIRVEMVRNGSTVTADSGTFEIFSDLPHVTGSAAPAVPEGIGVISRVEFTFNVPMNPATFSVAEDIHEFNGPQGGSVLGAISGTSWSADNTVLTVVFTPPSEPGPYQVVIGPDIEDSLGNEMDQDLDGTTNESLEDRYSMQFTVNPPLVYYTDMETDPAWDFSANNPADGWAYGQPTGGGANPYIGNDPTSGFNGPRVMGYNLNGDYEPGITSTRWATAPVMDCSNYKNLRLRFRRWLGIYYAGTNGDNAYIQVSNDGLNWTTVWEHGNSKLYDGDWVEVEYDISEVADAQTTVYVRWGLGPTDSSVNGDAPGWNLDEVTVFGDYLDSVLTTTPKGGESYFVDTPLNITWGSRLGGDVKIELLKGGVLDSTISASTANDGSFSWPIPEGQALASDYRIRITSLSDPSKTSTSVADFEITIPVAVPYSEGFESGLGVWEQNVSDDIDWLHQMDGTDSTGTGPDSAQDGSAGHYIYVEASSPNYPEKTAELSCWFNLKGFGQTEFSFYYHMLGESMGTLTVEASSDGVVWETVFTRTGDQGSVWLPATVSMDAYAGQYVAIRITGTTGSSWTSDIALDTLALSGTEASGAYVDWIAAYDVGVETTLEGDFDADGIPNAVENYFGTDPSVSNPGLTNLIQAQGESTTFSLTHPMNESPATDLSASYRWSKDLSSFHGHGESDGGTTVNFAVGDVVDGEVVVTATVSGTSTDRLFVIVEVLPK